MHKCWCRTNQLNQQQNSMKKSENKYFVYFKSKLNFYELDFYFLSHIWSVFLSLFSLPLLLCCWGGFYNCIIEISCFLCMWFDGRVHDLLFYFALYFGKLIKLACDTNSAASIKSCEEKKEGSTIYYYWISAAKVV